MNGREKLCFVHSLVDYALYFEKNRRFYHVVEISKKMQLAVTPEHNVAQLIPLFRDRNGKSIADFSFVSRSEHSKPEFKVQ